VSKRTKIIVPKKSRRKEVGVKGQNRNKTNAVRASKITIEGKIDDIANNNNNNNNNNDNNKRLGLFQRHLENT
jgi:hypothetical protein